MRSKDARPNFLVPTFMGRTDGYMLAKSHAEQLDLWREEMTRPAKVQILAMLALSDPKVLDHHQFAKIADIAETMGYEKTQTKEGWLKYQPWIYELIEETGLKLRHKEFEVYTHEPIDEKTKDGRRKFRSGLVHLSILQEFGFYYETEDGDPIDLNDLPEDQLIKLDASGKKPLYAIPALDKKGRVIKNKDGQPRRRLANGVTWTFSRRFANLSQNRQTAWVFYLDAVQTLRRYLKKPSSFDLMFLTLFWKHDGLIEMSHETLVERLNIRSKDAAQVEATIDAAFNDSLAEGIIDKPVTIREANYYKPTGKTGKQRRKNMVYQWQAAAKWRTKKINIVMDKIEPAVNP